MSSRDAGSGRAEPRITGTVVRGDGRGRLLGFPTANLILNDEPAVGYGIYAALVSIGGGASALPAVVSFGTRPTFSGSGARFEVHLLDWSGDLYGAVLVVELIEKLRDERRFDNEEALIEQMRDDVERTRAVLAVRRQ